MVLIAFGEAEANHSLGYGSSRLMPVGTASRGGDAALRAVILGLVRLKRFPWRLGLLPLAAPRPHQERRHGAQSCALNR